MSDVSGVDNQSSTTSGSAALAGIKSAIDNLNTGKAEISGQVFSGSISATNLSGTNTGDQTDATVSTSDVTTNNVSSTKHGYAPKSPADATKFLNGAATPAYAQVKDSDLATTDVTTNDVSTSKHGFAPKAPNDATKFLNGVGTYTVPPGTSPYATGFGAWASATADGNGHQVLTDAILVVTNASSATVVVLSDSASTPTTERGRSQPAGSGQLNTITVPIKKNDYYKITGTTSTAFLIPIS